MDITWCVAHTQPLKELLAKQHLQQQGYDVYLPRFKKLCRHARKVEEKLVPLFPRYIFVGMDLNSTRWRSINGTRGVSYLLMSKDFIPAKIPEDVILDLRSKEIAKEIVPLSSLVTFIKGDIVRIVDGAFKDHTAVFESLNEKSRVHLLLTFMGREMNVTLPLYSVEAR